MADETRAPAQQLTRDDDRPKRYAAYDTRYLRFVGGVHASEAKAREAAKAAAKAEGVKVDPDLDVREV